MKVGQVMSFLDVGLVPEEYREEFQRKLASAARRRPHGHLQGHAQGDRGGTRRAHRRRVRGVRRGADRRGLDRPGVPRGAARRPRGGGQGPVPGGRGGGPGRHAEPGSDPAPGQADRTRDGPAGDRRRDPLADRGGARLRARGPEPACAGADLPRPPVHRHPRCRHLALPRAPDGVRVRQRHGVRGDQGLPAGGPRPDQRDAVPLLFRLPVSPRSVLRRSPPRQLDAARRRPDGLLRLRPVQADAAGHGRARDPDHPCGDRGRHRRRSCGSAPRSASSRTPSKFNPDRVLAHFRASSSWYTSDREIESRPSTPPRC